MHPYKDNPMEIEKWIRTLSSDELVIFDMGYICALEGLLEQITESKHKIWDKIMRNPKAKDELESRIHILDIYETHFQKRINRITERLAKDVVQGT